AVLVVKRLLSGRHVDDRQATMPEAHARLDVQTALVRPAVMLGLVDARQQFATHVAPAVKVEHSNDAAHDSLFLRASFERLVAALQPPRPNARADAFEASRRRRGRSPRPCARG